MSGWRAAYIETMRQEWAALVDRELMRYEQDDDDD